MIPFEGYTPDWRWGTAEGSREFDRLLDRALTFREKLEWLEEAETMTLAFRAQREARRENVEPGTTADAEDTQTAHEPINESRKQESRN